MSRATHDALGVIRDLVQARLLAQLFAQKVHDVAIKGGMAMRVNHEKWARATKDIDLDAGPSLSLAALQNMIRRAIRSATSDGLLKHVQVTEPKQTEVTARWKISGMDIRTGQVLHLTVEVSRRDTLDPADLKQTLYGPSYGDGENELVTVYTDQALAFKKVKALLSDTREAPRDIADLYLLIQAKVEPPIAHLRHWFAAGGEAHLREMWRKLDRMDHAMFRAEVVPSLPPTPDGQDLYQDWDEIRLCVGEHVENWIRLARGETNVPEPERAVRRRKVTP